MKKLFLLGFLIFPIFFAQSDPLNSSFSAEERDFPDQQEEMDDFDLYNISMEFKVTDSEDPENMPVKSKFEKIVFLGKPIDINLRGSNFKAIVRITFYKMNEDSFLLLTQCTVLSRASADEKEQVFSAVKSLPVKIGEKILFFPLGVLSNNEKNSYNCILEINLDHCEKPVPEQ